MSSFNHLRSAGLTNADSEDFGSIAMGQRLAPAPFCYSDKCRGRFACVRKYVKGYPTACPDCGWSLRWTKVRFESNTTAAPD